PASADRESMATTSISTISPASFPACRISTIKNQNGRRECHYSCSVNFNICTSCRGSALRNRKHSLKAGVDSANGTPQGAGATVRSTR
ncbi:hypothetical protein H0H92_005461, partial [Tricholoma furcatifolium]